MGRRARGTVQLVAFNSTYTRKLTCVAWQLIEQLLWKFPEYHPSSLLKILNTVDMDVIRATKALRAISEKEQNGIGQVCRHYMQGECRRADCMVRHGLVC